MNRDNVFGAGGLPRSSADDADARHAGHVSARRLPDDEEQRILL